MAAADLEPDPAALATHAANTLQELVLLSTLASHVDPGGNATPVQLDLSFRLAAGRLVNRGLLRPLDGQPGWFVPTAGGMSLVASLSYQLGLWGCP